MVGVTGSVGKTSVKDLLAGGLAERWRTAASVRSFNNELGVPLTLLNAPDGTEAVVVEMGARGVGHIAELCAIARPTVGVVTRVAAVHTEVFGAIEDVARAKGELVEALPRDGHGRAQRRDARVAAMASRTAATRAHLRRPAATCGPRASSLDDELRPRSAWSPRGASAEVAPGGAGPAPGRERPGGRRGRAGGGRRLDGVVAGPRRGDAVAAGAWS